MSAFLDDTEHYLRSLKQQRRDDARELVDVFEAKPAVAATSHDWQEEYARDVGVPATGEL